MLKSRWLKILLLIPLCLSLGLIDSVRSYASAYHDGTFYLSWENAVRWDLSAWLVWILFIPLILRLSRRVRISQENLLWSAPAFGLLGLALAALKTIAPIVIYMAFVQPFDEILSWLSRTLFLLTDFLAAFVFYCFVLAFAQALNYYRQYRDEELRASRLESQLARAELHALKMQINPHFLFNTLHSISALQFEDADKAQTMTARLGDFLRLTLDDSGTQIVSLSREMDFLKCYLDIERARFGARLTTNFEVESGALAAEVPNLILQPLVENAVKHGIAKQAKTGVIRVSARIAGDKLRLEVADNGAGFERNGSGATAADHRGLGLSNVRERLRQLYGAGNYGFELKPAPEGGLLAAISLPLTLAGQAARNLN